MEDSEFSSVVDIIENLDILYKQIPENSGKIFDDYREYFNKEYSEQVIVLLKNFNDYECPAVICEPLEEFYQSAKIKLYRLLDFRKVVEKIKLNEGAVFKGELPGWS